MWKITRFASEVSTYFLVGMGVFYYTENLWMVLLGMIIPMTTFVTTHMDAYRRGMDAGADIVDTVYKEWLNEEVKRLEGQVKTQPKEQQDD